MDAAFVWPNSTRAKEYKSEFGETPVSVQMEGSEKIDGRPAYRLSYLQRWHTVEGWITEYVREWIDQENYRRLRSQNYNDDPFGDFGTVYTTRFMRFDEVPDIRPQPAWDAYRIQLPVLFRRSVDPGD